MISDIYYVIPEIFLSLSLMFLLILGVFNKKGSIIVYNLSLLILIITIPLILNVPSDGEILIFNESYKVDYLSNFIKILIVISTLFVLLTSSQYLKSIKIFNIEYPILILSSILGMMVMVSSNDLIVFYIGLELQSLALYVLASFNRDNILSISPLIAKQEMYRYTKDDIKNRIVKLCGDLPRIELFARQRTEGWDCWGNEV